MKEDLKKGKEKEEKEENKEKSDKTHVKIPLRSFNNPKNPQKQGRILEGGGGENFSGWPKYIPLHTLLKENLSLLTRKPTSSDDRVGMCLLWSALIGW